METNEYFSIFSDVELPDYDTFVQLYWAGTGWDQDTECSPDFPDIETAKQEARKAKELFPKAEVKILRIKSTTETEYIEVD